MTLPFESGPALIAKAPPQHRPMLIRPSWVKRKTGRLFSLASLLAVRMSLAQPISSNRFSLGVGCNSRTRCSTHAKSRRKADFCAPSTGRTVSAAAEKRTAASIFMTRAYWLDRGGQTRLSAKLHRRTALPVPGVNQPGRAASLPDRHRAGLSMNHRCFPRRFRATTDWRETKSAVALNLRGKPCVHGPNARQFGRGDSPVERAGGKET